ncbi:hypothetical protein R3P38DRAFT_2811356 [Favolaschia claudopus]|uniref:Uncharacterized protein n=1 Tax=Favolaschia claudopus TaxID=2862362 RepID=A0AAV9Z9D8_9AGAR
MSDPDGFDKFNPIKYRRILRVLIEITEDELIKNEKERDPVILEEKRAAQQARMQRLNTYITSLNSVCKEIRHFTYESPSDLSIDPYLPERITEILTSSLTNYSSGLAFEDIRDKLSDRHVSRLLRDKPPSFEAFNEVRLDLLGLCYSARRCAQRRKTSGVKAFYWGVKFRNEALQRYRDSVIATLALDSFFGAYQNSAHPQSKLGDEKDSDPTALVGNTCREVILADSRLSFSPCDGYACEKYWANLDPTFPSFQQMGAGTRHDMLAGNDWNARKLSKVSLLMEQIQHRNNYLWRPLHSITATLALDQLFGGKVCPKAKNLSSRRFLAYQHSPASESEIGDEKGSGHVGFVENTCREVVVYAEST